MNKVLKVTVDEHVVCAEKSLERVTEQTQQGCLTLVSAKKGREGVRVKYSQINIEEDHAGDETFTEWVSIFMSAVDDHAESMTCQCDGGDHASSVKH